MKLLEMIKETLHPRLMGGRSGDLEKKEEYAEDHLIERARQEWLTALSIFDSVLEPELIDQAIYNINATERRYVFLLKEKKLNRGLSN